MAPNSPELIRLVADLNAEVNAAYGLYLDATMGFAENVRKVEQSQKETGTTDDNRFFYTLGDPLSTENVLLHETTQGDFKARNSDEGPNCMLLARFLIVILYELWETGYRSDIAKAADLPRSKLLLPVFGDLKRLRNAILHNKGRLTPQTAQKLEVVATPTTNSVDLDKKDVERLVRDVKAALDSLVESVTGDDPGYQLIAT